MEITSRPTSSFCRPGQEQLRFACWLGGKGAGGAQVERICYLNISLSFHFFSCFGLMVFCQLLMLFLIMPFFFYFFFSNDLIDTAG